MGRAGGGAVGKGTNRGRDDIEAGIGRSTERQSVIGVKGPRQIDV
jgi:hypothetical protein